MNNIAPTNFSLSAISVRWISLRTPFTIRLNTVPIAIKRKKPPKPIKIIVAQDIGMGMIILYTSDDNVSLCYDIKNVRTKRKRIKGIDISRASIWKHHYCLCYIELTT